MQRMLITRIGAIAVTVLVGLAHPPDALAQDLGQVYVQVMNQSGEAVLDYSGRVSRSA